jgi:hypothetical protein
MNIQDKSNEYFAVNFFYWLKNTGNHARAIYIMGDYTTSNCRINFVPSPL